MKLIDFDKTGNLYIQKTPAQSNAFLTKQIGSAVANHTPPPNQMSDFVRLIKDNSEKTGTDEHINQITREINANTYHVDLDLLIDNIFNDLNHSSL